MKKQKMFLAALTLLFVIVVFAVVTTLSLNAIDTSHTTASGRWATVCCGKICPGGEDICHGDGTYSCCK